MIKKYKSFFLLFDDKQYESKEEFDTYEEAEVFCKEVEALGKETEALRKETDENSPLVVRTWIEGVEYGE